MDPKRLVGYEICTVSKLFDRIATSTLEKKGITRMQSWIIRYLYECSFETNTLVFQKDIEANFHIPRSTATGLLQAMEKNGLLTRASVGSDARLKRLILTEKGIAIHNLVKDILDQIEVMACDGIPEDQLDAFIEVMHLLKENLRRNLLT